MAGIILLDLALKGANMHVWIVEWFDSETWQLVGVFTTLAKAHEAASTHAEDCMTLKIKVDTLL